RTESALRSAFHLQSWTWHFGDGDDFDRAQAKLDALVQDVPFARARDTTACLSARAALARGRYVDGVARCEALLGQPGVAPDTERLARHLLITGRLHLGDVDGMQKALEALRHRIAGRDPEREAHTRGLECVGWLLAGDLARARRVAAAIDRDAEVLGTRTLAAQGPLLRAMACVLEGRSSAMDELDAIDPSELTGNSRLQWFGIRAVATGATPDALSALRDQIARRRAVPEWSALADALAAGDREALGALVAPGPCDVIVRLLALAMRSRTSA
ncbi:MAG: hypothetical protein AAF602_14355, partial [Myxococcota bacterium]